MEQEKKLTEEQKRAMIEEVLNKWQEKQELEKTAKEVEPIEEKPSDEVVETSDKTVKTLEEAKDEDKDSNSKPKKNKKEKKAKKEKEPKQKKEKPAKDPKELSEKQKQRMAHKAEKKKKRLKRRIRLEIENGIYNSEKYLPKKDNKDAKKDVNPFKLIVDKIGEVMMWIVIGIDWFFGKIDEFVRSCVENLFAEINSILFRYIHSRKRIWKDIFGMLIICCFVLIVFDRFTIFEYAYNGRVLGYVENQSQVTEVLDVAGENLSKNNDIDVSFVANDNVSFRRVPSKDKTVDDSDKAVNKLAYMTDIEAEAYGIYEDGRFLTYVQSEPIAAGVVKAVKSKQSIPDEGMTLISSKFVGDIEVKPMNTMLTNIQSSKKAVEQLTKGGTYNISYIAKADDTKSSIAKTYNVSTSDIYDASNENQVKGVVVDDKLTIRKKVEPIKVEMLEEGTMTEIIKFKTIKQETKDLYIGDTHVKQAGKDGKNAITGKVTKVNGEITKKDLTKSEEITKVVNEIILVGTTVRPKTAPTGVFGMPIRTYVITSEFGWRWGRNHDGIDFGAPVGTPLYAADGGTVIQAGWYGGYGLVVDIDHGGGKMTRYGHCDSLSVSAGEKVYKGQVIAACGNTGNSTGPHLHFEIRQGGAAIDPGPILGLY